MDNQERREQGQWKLISELMRSMELELAADQVRGAFDRLRPERPSRRMAAFIRADSEPVVDYQRERLESYAALKGWEIGSVTIAKGDDPTNADLSKRPGLQKLKRLVDADIDTIGILVTNYGVLASNADLCLEVVDQLPVAVFAMIEDAVYESI